MAHTLVCLRFADPVTEAVARLTTGAGGLTLRRTGFAPAGRQTKFHEGIATSNSLWPALPGRTEFPIRSATGVGPWRLSAHDTRGAPGEPVQAHGM